MRGARLLPENTYLETETKTRFFIHKNPFRIGKQSVSSDLRLNNSLVSRNHAEILYEDGDYYITDMFSTNGTYINDIRLESGKKTLIKCGDVIRFAKVSMRFMSE